MTRLALTSVSLLALAMAVPAAAQSPSSAPTARGSQSVAATPVRRAMAFAASAAPGEGSLVIPMASVDDLAARGTLLNESERTAITRAIGAAEQTFGARSMLTLRGIGNWRRITLIGTGESPDLAAIQSVGAAAARAHLGEDGTVTVAAEGLSAEQIAELATGMGIGEYRTDFHRTVDRPAVDLGTTTIVAANAPAAEPLYRRRGVALIDAVAWTRDISNEPANIVYPESFVDRTRVAFAGVRGVTIDVLDVPAMERLGMGAILGVGVGSARPPRMLIVRYRGPGSSDNPVVMAGKGITFDSGGISIKPSAGMGDMKMDMSGAASVTGAVLALARSEAPVHAVAIAALAENMPDGNSIRPADVLRAMNGKTIEIISTDAEGRLVLADALSYADARLSPAAVVDVATLTGAIGTALGDDYSGLFTRHDALSEQLLAAGTATGEAMWRMPIHPSYAEDAASTIADLKNGGTGGGGASFGAYFIGEFISRSIPWAHIDMANEAWGPANDVKPAGSVGWGVRMLERFVRDFQPVPANLE
jgi:leucyl aminopeptidase